MPHGQQAPAPSAEGPTQHTPNQADAPRLTAPQLRLLHGGIHPNRVRNLRGMAHLEAWDVRRELIRVFGFGGFSIETISLDLVHQEGGMRRKKDKKGQEYGEPYMAWTVVYRAQVRLTVLDTNGREISHWEDGAAGDSVNQPSLGDAHDMGMKTALSQALKRCAVNLGDQFGLSLYNDGAREPVVLFSAAHPPQEWQKQPAPVPEPDDPPVKPEPQPATAEEPAAPAAAAAARPERPAKAPAAKDPVEDALLAKLMKQTQDHWTRLDVLTQVRGEAEAKGLLARSVQGPDGKWTPFSLLLDNQIAALGQGGEQRSAA